VYKINILKTIKEKGVKKLILASFLTVFTGSSANAGFVFNNDITGADMAGIEVTVGFTTGDYETSTWSVYSTDLGTTGNDIIDYEGFSGGASGTNWSLTQSGFTLGNTGVDSTIYGLWNFINSSDTVKTITINTGDTGVLFDTASFDDLSEDNNGSGQGRSFITDTPSEVTATYSDPVLQELSKILTLELTTAGTEFKYLADTDIRQEDDGSSAVVLIQDEVVNVANEEVLNDTLASSAEAASELVGALEPNGSVTDAQAAINAAAANGNEVAVAIKNNSELVAAVANDPTILTDATSTDITSLPPVIDEPSTPEEIASNLRNSQVLEIVEDVIAQSIRSGTSGSTVTGNGDINVEIAANTGEVTFGLSVTNENIGESVDFTNFINTPDQIFTIDFNLIFETLTGSLTLSLENSLYEIFNITYFAEDFQNLSSASWVINDDRFFDLTNAKLNFSLFPGSPASASFNNINVSFLQNTIPVSAPSSILLLSLSILGLSLRTRRKSV
jgi:hypothetical protein